MHFKCTYAFFTTFFWQSNYYCYLCLTFVFLLKKGLCILAVLGLLALMCEGCKSHFKDWKEYNENYLNELTNTLQSNASLHAKISDTGLRYGVLFSGLGPIPKSNSLVKINYTAHLVDGTQCTPFDTLAYLSSYPAGLQEALLQMHQESIWTLVIPSDIAFGEYGTKNTYGNYVIPPYTTIYVDKIELVSTENY